MGPYAFAKIDRSHDLTFIQVNDTDELTVGSGLADAGVAVNRDKSVLAIGRCHHLMARHPILRNGGNLAPRDRIDDPECLVAFIRDKQQSVSGFGLSPI